MVRSLQGEPSPDYFPDMTPPELGKRSTPPPAHLPRHPPKPSPVRHEGLVIPDESRALAESGFVDSFVQQMTDDLNRAPVFRDRGDEPIYLCDPFRDISAGPD